MVNTDFVTLLAELAKKKITQKAIADRAGCTQAAICDIARGNTLDPRFNTGMTIIQLHNYHVKGIKA